MAIEQTQELWTLRVEVGRKLFAAALGCSSERQKYVEGAGHVFVAVHRRVVRAAAIDLRLEVELQDEGSAPRGDRVWALQMCRQRFSDESRTLQLRSCVVVREETSVR